MALCAVYAERHCMEPMLDAKKCLGCHCMPVHFPTVRNWSVLCKRLMVGIGSVLVRNGNDSLLAVAEGAEWGLERIPFE